MEFSPNWLPAGFGDDPIRIDFKSFPSPLSPTLYELLASGDLSVRWNGQFLPLKQATPSEGGGSRFVVPAHLRTPGITEFVLWDSRLQQPLPFRGWVSVVIPTPASLFEADPGGNRVAAYVSANGTSDGFGGEISLYQLSSGAVAGSIQIPSSQRVMTFTPDALYAWLALDGSQSRFARLNLTTNQLDQQIQLSDGSPPYTNRLWLDPSNPRILIVQIVSSSLSGVRAYLDGVRLPGTIEGAVITYVSSGRLLLSDGRTCLISPSAGVTSCTSTQPVRAQTFWGLLRNLGIASNGIFDLTTGNQVSTLGGLHFEYLDSSNRMLLRSERYSYVADGDSFEVFADIGPMIRTPKFATFARLRNPDWLMEASDVGLLIGRFPLLAPRPSFSADGVFNAASLRPGPITPGEIISIFGDNIGPTPALGPVLESTVRLSKEVEQTQVLFDGVAGTILYASSRQINVVAPETLPTSGSAVVQVVRYGIPSSRILVPRASASPGIFGYSAQGRIYVAALSASGAVQGPSTPLRRGDTVSLFATGIGIPDNTVSSDIAARARQLPVLPTVTAGGASALVRYAGAAPGLTIGATQMNVVIPADAPVGPAIEIRISSSGETAGNVWVAIQ